MLRITGILLVSTALLMSCQGTNFPSEVKSIDYLIDRIDSAKITHSGVDTTGYAQFRKSYVSNLGFVEQNFKSRGDTIDRELAFFLTGYRALKKPYRDFKSKYEQADKDLIFTEKQLLTLKHDVEHNTLEVHMVSKFMQNETQAVIKIVGTVNQLALSNETTRRKASTLEMQMDSVITLLKSK